MTQIDLTQILKDCPEGTKLYSLVYGDVFLNEVKQGATYPIRVQTPDGGEFGVMSDGRLCADFDGECTLFPSRENRDWSTFKPEQPKPEGPQEFAPFEKVLVRDYDHEQWWPQIYSFYAKGDKYPHVCAGSQFKQCIPYEGNEHLLGTTDEPKGKGE